MEAKTAPLANDERFVKAIAALRKKNFDYALELCHKVLSDYPDSAECRHLLWTAAREKLRQQPSAGIALPIQRLRCLILHVQSIIFDLTQRAPQAIARQEQLVLLSPDSIPALLRLANLFLRHNMPPRRRAALEEVISLDKNNYPALRQLASVYFQAKDYRSAQTAASQALKINPRDLAAENILRDITVLGVIAKGFDNIKPAT